MTWRKGKPWSRRVRETCAENPTLVQLARDGDKHALIALRMLVCPQERLDRIGKQSMRVFAQRDAEWLLDEYLATSAIELLGDLTDE